MTKKQIAALAVEALKAEYPDSICSLEYTDPLQCLVATRLSAQCTDARVNMVTPELFKRYTCAEDFAESTPEESNDFCHRLVLHGRAVCTARKAMCESCCMSGFCRKKA